MHIDLESESETDDEAEDVTIADMLKELDIRPVSGTGLSLNVSATVSVSFI